MSRLDEILTYNQNFVEDKHYEKFHTDKYPDKNMVILTCMDTRLVELLPKAMNISNGDAKVIKNAGALVSHPFGGIMRSILVAVYMLKAKEVFVVGHHDCGMTGMHATPLLEKAIESGVSTENIDILKNAGINIESFLQGFSSVEESVLESVNMIKNHPLMPKNTVVHGLIIHPDTGKLDVVIDGAKEQ
ncbi:beta-class carbonic anhydrase [Bacillus suaedaesalsae]|uniref:carbonic anhydrase n=1 Tax=Bacillus suaedaesalsae TaxID=2810349 RepID=A0ABS2DLN2_9BACI|nr:carbonic anhydrase [Bacillus suaedaesalsae]MBM6619302.1 carbonic anhydrase [Bacillus suaedaesalsae]